MHQPPVTVNVKSFLSMLPHRADHGVVLNCFGFWFERNPDWVSQYDAGDAEMSRRGVRRLSIWTVGWLMTWFDNFQARKERLQQAVLVSKSVSNVPIVNSAEGDVRNETSDGPKSAMPQVFLS